MGFDGEDEKGERNQYKWGVIVVEKWRRCYGEYEEETGHLPRTEMSEK